jgi:hypothetical protein
MKGRPSGLSSGGESIPGSCEGLQRPGLVMKDSYWLRPNLCCCEILLNGACTDTDRLCRQVLLCISNACWLQQQQQQQCIEACSLCALLWFASSSTAAVAAVLLRPAQIATLCVHVVCMMVLRRCPSQAYAHQRCTCCSACAFVGLVGTTATL